jgi:hypothetical protein
MKQYFIILLKKVTRSFQTLTKTLFYKKLPNGENILRKWMVLSKGSLFCAICKLFAADNQFGYEGFNDSMTQKW